MKFLPILKMRGAMRMQTAGGSTQCSPVRNLLMCSIVMLSLSTFSRNCEAQSRDAGTDKALANITRMAAACPNGNRTAKQQAECRRVIDSIQADRKRVLNNAKTDVAIALSEDFLMDTSFLPDDDGRKVTADRWVRIGTIRGEKSGSRARITMKIGIKADALVRVGAILTAEKDLLSIVVQLDCNERQAQVLQLLYGDDIEVAQASGFGPWYSLGKDRSVLQAIGRRTCG